MRQISPHQLWIGNALDLWDPRHVIEHGIVAVVDLAANEPPSRFTRDMTYCRFPLVDGAPNPTWLLRMAIETVSELASARVPTLVVCSAGMSRSPAVAAAALALQGDQDFSTCLESIVTGFPHDVSPALIAEIESVLDSRYNQL